MLDPSMPDDVGDLIGAPVSLPPPSSIVDDSLATIDRILAADDSPAQTRALALQVPWLVDQLRTAQAALAILREASMLAETGIARAVALHVVEWRPTIGGDGYGACKGCHHQTDDMATDPCPTRAALLRVTTRASR